MPTPDLPALRDEYRRTGLSEDQLGPDPLRQFAVWLDRAIAEGAHSPNAMTLATADPEGRPSARTVLLKAVDAEGFVWFTNHDSRKGHQLAANPQAALVFHWPLLGRQVCATGAVVHVDDAESDAYFASRPRGSQLSTWASAQSRVIRDRATLEAAAAAAAERFAEGAVPRPPHWGGYRLVPDAVEFWQGRPDRLHDRLRYTRDPAAGWVVERLAP
jgi:pyridoxamine 5'-phosphate oxidase